MDDSKPQVTTTIAQPSGPVNVSANQKESVLTWLMKWGGFGFVAMMFWWQSHTNHADQREDVKTNREAHDRVFEKLRADTKEAMEFDREQRSKTNKIMREGNATLKAVEKTLTENQNALISSLMNQQKSLENQAKTLETVKEMVKEIRKMKEMP